MIFVYNGYTLNIEEVFDTNTQKSLYFRANCKEVLYYPSDTNLNCIINNFRDRVDDTLDKKKKQENAEKESSAITFTYLYFTSNVSWDKNTCVWLIKHIYDKADTDILKGSILTGKYIQELQGRFEDYIDKYLKKKNSETRI